MKDLIVLHYDNLGTFVTLDRETCMKLEAMGKDVTNKTRDTLIVVSFVEDSVNKIFIHGSQGGLACMAREPDFTAYRMPDSRVAGNSGSPDTGRPDFSLYVKPVMSFRDGHVVKSTSIDDWSLDKFIKTILKDWNDREIKRAGQRYRVNAEKNYITVDSVGYSRIIIDGDSVDIKTVVSAPLTPYRISITYRKE